MVELRIPNREIANIFQKAVVDNFNNTVDQNMINELMQALWNGEEEKASEILSYLLFFLFYKISCITGIIYADENLLTKILNS